MNPDDPMESHPIPPPEFSGKNLHEEPMLIQCAGYDVAEWCPLPNGQGPATAVLLQLVLSGSLDGAKIALRIKSRLEMNRLLKILTRHRDNVWPEQP